jgi:site-specific DNA-methyltransferase (adenine-specific)
MRVHHSTGKDDWETPIAFFAPLCEEFDIRVDLAANEANHLCPQWFGPNHPKANRRDTLALTADATYPTKWAWCNPPYSRTLQPAFVRFCATRRRVVMLLPARTDTFTFHHYIWNTAAHRPLPQIDVRFVKGRIKFVGAPDAAPFPSMVVIFRPL